MSSKKDAKKKQKVSVPKVDDALLKKAKSAQSALEDYFKENGLDPTKDYSKNKKHGEKIKALVAVVNKTRDKIKADAPEEKHHQKSTDKKKKVEGTEKAKKASAPSKYNYPLVDGREMTSQEKKKYRVKMRSGSSDKPAKSDKVSKESKSAKPEKPSKATKSEKSVKAPEPAKPGKKKSKDKKKVRKED